MRAIVGRYIDALDRPPLPIRKSRALKSREVAADKSCPLLVPDVLDARLLTRRIGSDVIHQRHGEVDDAARHAHPNKQIRKAMVARSSRLVDACPSLRGQACRGGRSFSTYLQASCRAVQLVSGEGAEHFMLILPTGFAPIPAIEFLSAASAM